MVQYTSPPKQITSMTTHIKDHVSLIHRRVLSNLHGSLFRVLRFFHFLSLSICRTKSTFLRSALLPPHHHSSFAHCARVTFDSTAPHFRKPSRSTTTLPGYKSSCASGEPSCGSMKSRKVTYHPSLLNRLLRCLYIQQRFLCSVLLAGAPCTSDSLGLQSRYLASTFGICR